MRNKGFFLRTITDVLRWWPTILDGLQYLNETQGKGKDIVTPDDLLKVTLQVALGEPDEGFVLVLTSKNDKFLGYLIGFNNTDVTGPKRFVLWAAYSNSLSPTATNDMLYIAEQWGKKNGYKSVQAQSLRVSKAATRIFTKKWGFETHAILFQKELL